MQKYKLYDKKNVCLQAKTDESKQNEKPTFLQPT